MKEKVKFIEGGFPLANRIWFEVDENLTKSKVKNFIEEHLCSIPESLTLETHLYVDKPSEKTNDNLIEILKDIYQFKIGYEKSFPIVSIYYPYHNLDDDILSRINECDKHRPGIRLYILVRDNDLPIDKSLSSLRELAGTLFDKQQKSQDIGLDVTLYFLIERDSQKLDQFFDLRRLTYTWDTSINIKRPLLQVSPHISIERNEVEKLGKYIQKESESVNTFDTLCGLTNLLVRYKENKTVPTQYIPLGGCGAGVSERKLSGKGLSTSCFFSSKSLLEKVNFDQCKECDHVSNCTGCLLMCTEFGECKLKNVFDIYSQMV